jgi:uncharacterized protein (TIGR03790 family)
MKKLALAWVLVLGGVPPLALGQSITYDDVVVVVNSNDSVSVALGNYFMAARSIPAVNLIAVDAPLAETIDAAQFGVVKQQIKSYMQANNLVGPINYMVMIKGMPHRVGSTDCDSVPPNGCSALDSEFTLLFSQDSVLMLGSIGAQNPLFLSTDPHSFATDHTLLVTRLDGTNAMDVMALIDRSGPLLPIVKQDVILIGDVQNATTSTFTSFFWNTFNIYLDPLNALGWDTLVDTVNTSLSDSVGVLAFLTHDGAPSPGVPDLEWSNGGLAMAYTYATAGSFNTSTVDPQKLRCSDLIADGAYGVRGSVNPSFASAQVTMGYTLQRYLEQPGSNLAESYYSGIQLLSRSDLILGDPKTSITISVGLGPDTQRATASLQVFPNPCADELTVPMERSKVLRCRLLAMDGRAVMEPVLPPGAGPISLSVKDLLAGAYVVQLHTTEGLRMAWFTVVH